jgi:hypothetical protein
MTIFKEINFPITFLDGSFNKMKAYANKSVKIYKTNHHKLKEAKN